VGCGPEAGAHDNGLVTVLLVVIEYLTNRQHSRVSFVCVCLFRVGLVPVQDTAHERRDERRLRLCRRNRLHGIGSVRVWGVRWVSCGWVVSVVNERSMTETLVPVINTLRRELPKDYSLGCRGGPGRS
jgi:hypothetical protein